MDNKICSKDWLENPGYMYDYDGNSNPITIYRNAGFSLPIQCEDINDYFASVTGYLFTLIIAAVPSINSPQANTFGTPVIINTTPDVEEPGLITFNVLPGDTQKLIMTSKYHLVVMIKQPLMSPDVKLYRRIRLIDAPSMPPANPII